MEQKNCAPGEEKSCPELFGAKSVFFVCGAVLGARSVMTRQFHSSSISCASSRGVLSSHGNAAPTAEKSLIDRGVGQLRKLATGSSFLQFSQTICLDSFKTFWAILFFFFKKGQKMTSGELRKATTLAIDRNRSIERQSVYDDED